jgi:hypothetical protein
MAAHPLTVDDERRGAIAEFDVNLHLRRHAIAGAGCQSRDHEQRIADLAGLQLYTFEKVYCGP